MNDLGGGIIIDIQGTFYTSFILMQYRCADDRLLYPSGCSSLIRLELKLCNLIS